MDNQPQGKKFAVIIGVGNYPSLPTIANTVTDAGDINELLTDPARGGLARANVRLLTDTQADARGIDNAFNWLAKQATTDDTVFIFFSGHGLSRAGGRDAGSYLCPYDVDATNLKDTAFSGDDLQKSLSSIKAGKLVMFLDCCYAGGTVGGDVSGGLSRTTYLALANSGQALYSSSGSGELSYIMPDARNSLFTACLLEVFSGKGVSTGRQFVSAYDVANYITSEVPARNPKQNPFTLVVAGGFPLVPNPLYQAGSATITPPPPITQPAQPPTLGQPTGVPFTPSKPSIVNNVGTGIGSVESINGGNFNFGSGTQNNVRGNQNNVTGTQNNVQGNQYNSGRDQFIGNRNVNTGGGNIHDYGGVQGNVNSGSGNQTTVHTGNINSNQGNVAVGSGINQNYGGNPQQPDAPTYNAMTLHQGFRRANLSEDDLRLIGQYLALNGAGVVDYDTLAGANPTFKALSLIQYCQQHRCLTALIDTLNGDESWQPVLGGNYAAWRNWAAGEDSKL